MVESYTINNLVSRQKLIQCRIKPNTRKERFFLFHILPSFCFIITGVVFFVCSRCTRSKSRTILKICCKKRPFVSFVSIRPDSGRRCMSRAACLCYKNTQSFVWLTLCCRHRRRDNVCASAFDSPSTWSDYSTHQLKIAITD